MSVINEVRGGPELLNWFEGRAPRFHDAEVLSLSLDRLDASAALKVHTFQVTPEVDSRGHFICTRHVIVTFTLKSISSIELRDFNHQNALYGLSLNRTENGEFRLDMEPAFGLFGYIQAADVEIALQPGLPEESIYPAAEAETRLNSDAEAARFSEIE